MAATVYGEAITAYIRRARAILTALISLGRVESESQSGQDVTSQYVDLQARLSNARTTESRLTDMLQQRTGKLSDVLEVEQEVDRFAARSNRWKPKKRTCRTR